MRTLRRVRLAGSQSNAGPLGGIETARAITLPPRMMQSPKWFERDRHAKSADTGPMGDDFDFRRILDAPPRRRRGNIVPFRRLVRRRKPAKAGQVGPLVAAGLIGGAALGIALTQFDGRLPSWPAAKVDAGLGVGCVSPRVLDGDTIRCGDTRIRLSSIDAPELPGHCRPGRECTPGDPYASTGNLQSLVAGQPVQCQQTDTDYYGRAVARCSVQGRDLSCAQVEGGFAVRRYGFLSC